MDDQNAAKVEGEILRIQDIGKFFLFEIHSIKDRKVTRVPCSVPKGYGLEKGIRAGRGEAFGHLGELNGELGLHCERLDMRGTE